MLMDEPLSNLDAKLRNQMRAEIIKLRQRREPALEIMIYKNSRVDIIVSLNYTEQGGK